MSNPKQPRSRVPANPLPDDIPLTKSGIDKQYRVAMAYKKALRAYMEVAPSPIHRNATFRALRAVDRRTATLKFMRQNLKQFTRAPTEPKG